MISLFNNCDRLFHFSGQLHYTRIEAYLKVLYVDMDCFETVLIGFYLGRGVASTVPKEIEANLSLAGKMDLNL